MVGQQCALASAGPQQTHLQLGLELCDPAIQRLAKGPMSSE